MDQQQSQQSTSPTTTTTTGQQGQLQQNSNDLVTNLSHLNVNAMEFIPTFGSTTPTTTTTTTTTPADNDDQQQSSSVNRPTDLIIQGQSQSQQQSPMDTTEGTTTTEGGVGGDEKVVATAADNYSDNNDDESEDDWEELHQEGVAGNKSTTPPEENDDDDDDSPSTETMVTKKKKNPIQTGVDDVKSKKEHVNVVFIGHVDAGKSTIGGQIMYLTGMVDKRTLEKYEREAKEKNRETWYLSWALDTNQEERDKGKTVEVGRASFETEKKHFSILDAPGHKSFVPNMISGAAQADLAVLVISARKGEFETGFEKGGQTREHAMLVKTAGVKYLIVLINKMDDPTVNWDESRYNECKDKLLPYLKKLGFQLGKDLVFMPCSGLTGFGLKETIDSSVCGWYSGPPFIPFLDQLPPLNRPTTGPFLLPIVDKYKDMGTVILGKVESGSCTKGQQLLLMPNRTPITVDTLYSDDGEEVGQVSTGENVKMKLKGVEEEDISTGFIVCDSPCTVGRIFDAQVAILEYKSIICAGYSAVMHIHCIAEEVQVKALISLVDKKTGEKSKTRPRFVKQDQVVIMRLECLSGVVCMEPFSKFPQLGRFTLRDEGKTIAIGKVLKVVE